MAMNRLTRDQIISRGLDMVDSAALDQHDRPGDIIVSNAYSIGWLQDALDFFQKKFPFQSTVTTPSLTLTVGTTTVAVPALYIIDVRNGLVLDSDEGRLFRRSLSYILDRPVGTVDKPRFYTIRGNLIHFWPKADKTYTAKLYQYTLDAVLTANVIPNFPDDHILVEYIRLRGLEWHRAIPPGSALRYCDDLVKQLQNSGIMQEAEDDQIGFDPENVGDRSNASYDWMGKTVG